MARDCYSACSGVNFEAARKKDPNMCWGDRHSDFNRKVQLPAGWLVSGRPRGGAWARELATLQLASCKGAASVQHALGGDASS